MSEAAVAEVQSVEQHDPSWTAPLTVTTDRCDRCGSQAFVRTVIRVGATDARPETKVPLVWCAHHYHRFEVGLLPTTVYVHDERDRINVAPSTSANV